MNEQKNDSVSQETIPSLPEVSKTPSAQVKEHKSVLDSITKLWHKKNLDSLTHKKDIHTAIQNPENISSPVIKAPEVYGENQVAVPLPKKTHTHISEKIAHIFHKKSQEKHIETPTVIEPTQNFTTDTVKKEETPFVIDERFARLLKHDTTYHSMLRSEDIKNIRLQLSMRYMLLMLAIFVVIAWVVNNRVIMFGFSDFPLLARTRDALFVLLTGLFSLTVWFGSNVWFSNRIGVLILRILATLLFLTVLVSIYLPFLG